MNNDTLIVYTGVNLEMLEHEGGSGYWRLDKKKMENIHYILFLKNHSQPYAQDTDKIPNGTAFLIAKVSGLFTETDALFKGKKVVRLSEYAEISIPNAWLKLTETGGLPAFRYFDSKEITNILGLNFNQLAWKKFTPSANPKPHYTRIF